MDREGALRLVESQPEGTFFISAGGIVVQRLTYKGELRWKSHGRNAYAMGYSDRLIANTIAQDLETESWAFS